MRSRPTNGRGGAGVAVLLILSLSLVGLPAGVFTAGAAEQRCALPPSDEDMARLETLRPDRPRIIASQEDILRAAEFSRTEAKPQAWREQLRAAADLMVGAEPARYYKVGPRLQFFAYKNRILTLALAWRLEGDIRYAQQAEREMLAAADYPDWNPGHYLDTAEMTAATALGYDWFHDVLLPESQTTIRTAIVDKGLKTSRCFYREGRGPTARTDNWGIVTNAGLAMGAMAVAETNPRLAAAVLGQALRRVAPGMARFGADGTYPEGLAYWRYATEHAVKLIASLEAGFGSDFGIGSIGGFANAGNHPLRAIGPSGKVANFSNATEKLGAAPQLYWLARRYQRPVDAWQARNLSRKAWSPLHLLWYSPDTLRPGTAGFEPSVLSSVQTAFLRGGWRSGRTGYAAVKGGANYWSHSHPELGSFVFDLKGRRWASDLGKDDFNLPGYFDPSRRRQYYRLSTRGQNTLRIDGREQPSSASASVRHFEVEADRSEVVLGLADAYPAATAVRRGVALLQRRALLIQDEVTASSPVSVRWAMHTRADIILGSDGTSATLLDGDEKITARILPTGGTTPRFTVASAERAEPEAPNRGVSRLQIRTTTSDPPDGRKSRLRLAVLLSPGSAMQPPPIQPLSAW